MGFRKSSDNGQDRQGTRDKSESMNGEERESVVQVVLTDTPEDNGSSC